MSDSDDAMDGGDEALCDLVDDAVNDNESATNVIHSRNVFDCDVSSMSTSNDDDDNVVDESLDIMQAKIAQVIK